MDLQFSKNFFNTFGFPNSIFFIYIKVMSANDKTSKEMVVVK